VQTKLKIVGERSSRASYSALTGFSRTSRLVRGMVLQIALTIVLTSVLACPLLVASVADRL
jgi:hypothetical protein